MVSTMEIDLIFIVLNEFYLLNSLTEYQYNYCRITNNTNMWLICCLNYISKFPTSIVFIVSYSELKKNIFFPECYMFYNTQNKLDLLPLFHHD